VWEHAGIICTGETYRQVVKLTFASGTSLKHLHTSSPGISNLTNRHRLQPNSGFGEAKCHRVL
jgi:hypothetical protein